MSVARVPSPSEDWHETRLKVPFYFPLPQKEAVSPEIAQLLFRQSKAPRDDLKGRYPRSGVLNFGRRNPAGHLRSWLSETLYRGAV